MKLQKAAVGSPGGWEEGYGHIAAQGCRTLLTTDASLNSKAKATTNELFARTNLGSCGMGEPRLRWVSGVDKWDPNKPKEQGKRG